MRDDELRGSRLRDDKYARDASCDGEDDGGSWVRIEIEAFDTGHLWFAKQLVEEGIIPEPVMIQMCMGVPWGAPDDLNTFMAMINNAPADWTVSAFSLGRNEMPYAAASVLAGANIRVGLEDNLWLKKGELATNAQLVEKAATIVTNMGCTLMTPGGARKAPVAKAYVPNRLSLSLRR